MVFHSEKKIRHVKESLDKVNLGYLIDKRIGALSGGKLQRAIACACSLIPC